MRPSIFCAIPAGGGSGSCEMNASDSELLQRFVRDGSEDAFTELLRRHVDLVFSAALRQVRLDAQAAEDVTQTVFTDLARKARQLTQHPTLTGWLYTSTRLAATQHRRTDSRRLAREIAAHTMSRFLASDAPEPDWNQLRGVLDEAMHDLNDADREAVLLRFFEKRPLAEIGVRLGLSENTARMRVERALDKLHAALAKRGITSTAAALSLALSVHAVSAAPAGLVERIASVARADGLGVTVGGPASSKLLLVSLTLLLGIGTLMWTSRNGWNRASSADGEGAGVVANSRANETETTPPDSGENTGIDATPTAATTDAATNADSLTGPGDPALKLTFLAKDSGRPVPNVTVNYRGWEGTHFTRRSLASTRLGEATVRVVPGTTRLELISVVEGFADTKLRWVPERGDPIPTNYTVRLERAVLIGGTVVDPEGRPVAGASVVLGHHEDGSEQKGVESWEFGPIYVKTDEEGRWKVQRIAESMLARLSVSAGHSEFQSSEHVRLSQHSEAERTLREQTHVFRLGAGGLLRGIVVNEIEEPLAGAKILVGLRSFDGSRETRTEADGTFEIRGTGLGTLPVTAEAEGYAAKTVQLNLTQASTPVRLVLGAGTPLRLRVVNRAGEPVPQASVGLNTMESGPRPVGAVTPLLQASFARRSDDQGRVVWNEAPPGEHHFDIKARGYLWMRRVAVPADGQEHIVTLPPALVIQGQVSDADTGRLVPKFRLVLGWLTYDPIHQRTDVQLSPIERFWLDFTGGTYRHSLEEEVFAGGNDPRCVVRFEAEGYLPHLSRPLRYDEGVVTLDVALEKASEIEVTVVDPTGRVARGATVGLVFPGVGLKLGGGRLAVDRDRYTRPGALKRADDHGRLKLMNDPQVTRLVFAHPTGYLETSFAALEADPFARLQPWGHIEGELLSTAGFLAGKVVTVSPWDLIPGEPAELDYDLTATTDGNGRFRLPQVPSGRLRVSHQIVTHHDHGVTTESGLMVEATVAPGETAWVTLGGGYRVMGRLRLPAGFTMPPRAQWIAQLHTPFPEPPAEIRNDPAALQQWFQTPEMQELARRAKQVPVAIQPDGSFTAESVSDGDYQLSMMLIPPLDPQPSASQPRAPLLSVKREVTVPTEPAVGEINLGEVAAEVPAETTGHEW